MGREVVELWPGASTIDARAAQTLAARGAKKVEAVKLPSGLREACADVVFALDVDPAKLAPAILEARRVLRPDGVLVLGVLSRDRPGATEGASYYDVVDACVGFPRVRMVGVAPFAGTTLVEYGVKDPEPILDGTLVERGERVEHYLAVAGPERRGDFGYGVVQVPVAAVAVPTTARAVDEEKLRVALAQAGAQLAELKAAVPPRAAQPAQPVDKLVAELRQALERHAGEMRAKEIELAERDALIAELELEGKQGYALAGRVSAAEVARDQAERRERDARKRIAELEGQLRAPAAVVAAAPVVVAPQAVVAAPPAVAVGEEVAALKKKLADAESETWRHMKARSEAEAAAAEVREDTVRKLKDARKLASVELMRAMEEATKKAVSLREELTRSEAERKRALAELEVARAAIAPAPTDDTTHRRELARAREEGEAAALAARAAAARAVGDAEAARLAAEASARDAEARAMELRGRLVGIERALASAERERDEARAKVAEAPREAAPSATSATGAEPRPLGVDAEHARLFEERNRIVDRLRAEASERDRRLIEIERERPPKPEFDRLRTELEQHRARLAELTLDLARRDVAVERAAAAAAHERARCERLVADERQALSDRNDARARAAEVTAQLAGLEAERDRVSASLEIAEAHARKSDNDVKEKRERIRQLKRELEDAERRASASVARGIALETVRARIHALESAVAGEVSRVAGIEATLRNAQR